MMPSERALLTPLFQYPNAEAVFKEKGEILPQLIEELDHRINKCIAKGWLSGKPKGKFWLYILLIKWNMVYSNMDCLGIVTGSEGAGKSNFDEATGMIVDETFEPSALRKRIIYSSEELHEFYDDEPQYSFGFIDEGGSLFGARDFNSKESKSLLRTLMIAREGANRLILVNVPYMSKIDTFLRNDRLRFAVRCRMTYDPRTMLLRKGTFDLFTKYRCQEIGNDSKGHLHFPRPDFMGYCPAVMGEAWRKYKEISRQKKAKMRAAEKEKVSWNEGDNAYGETTE